MTEKNLKEKKKTKILAIGDIHGDTGLVKRLAKKAEEEKVDLVILAGDLTYAEMSTDNLIGPFIKAKKKVLLLPGNHETNATVDFLASMYPNTTNLHCYSTKLGEKGEIGIFGCGGADFGATSLTEKEFFENLVKAHEYIKNTKTRIMVTHMHPAKSKSEFSGFEGSKGIRKALEKLKPDVLINAHIHEAGGIEETIGKTHVINVSRKARIFEI